MHVSSLKGHFHRDHHCQSQDEARFGGSAWRLCCVLRGARGPQPRALQEQAAECSPAVHTVAAILLVFIALDARERRDPHHIHLHGAALVAPDGVHRVLSSTARRQRCAAEHHLHRALAAVDVQGALRRVPRPVPDPAAPLQAVSAARMLHQLVLPLVVERGERLALHRVLHIDAARLNGRHRHGRRHERRARGQPRAAQAGVVPRPRAVPRVLVPFRERDVRVLGRRADQQPQPLGFWGLHEPIVCIDRSVPLTHGAATHLDHARAEHHDGAPSQSAARAALAHAAAPRDVAARVLPRVLQRVPRAQRRVGNYLKVTFHFVAFQYGAMSAIGASVTFLAILIYKHCIRGHFDNPWHYVYLLTGVVISLFSVLLVWHVNDMWDIPAFWFAAGDVAIISFAKGFQYLPLALMFVSVCPEQQEGVAFALLTSITNVSHAFAHTISNLLLAIWPVELPDLEQGHFDGVWKLTVLTAAISLVPLLFVRRLLPRGALELECMKDELSPRWVAFVVGIYAFGVVWVAVLSLVAIVQPCHVLSGGHGC